MWKRLRFWLPGLALVLGGVISGACHMFDVESPTDLAHVAQYPPLSAPVHLTLFAGGLLVLAGWVGRFAVRQSVADSTALAALICLFVGVVCGDLLHSILEFSVFSVVDQSAPYALPGLVDATYRSMPVSFLLIAGRILLAAGAAAFALATYREPRKSRWPAIPFGLCAALQVVAILPGSGESVRSFALAAMYFSMAALGMTLLLDNHAPISEPLGSRSCKAIF